MRQTKRAAAGILAALLAFFPGVLASSVSVQAAAGTVYTCTVNRCYAHPVTGEIEDSGGEASYATGQGMVEGAVSSTGILEVTDSGEYYLTFRISLVDFTSNHGFSVQNTGDSGWSAVTPAVTANGSDSNGTTSDLRIQVPSENCVVRGSMYVTPMGRDVIFYFYPNNYMEGNATDMTAAVVTESAGSGTETVPAAAGTGQTTPAEESSPTLSPTETDGEQESAGLADTDEDSRTATSEDTEKTASQGRELASSITQAASPTAAASDTELNSAQGLNLSTATEVESEENSEPQVSRGIGSLIVAITVSLTLSGLILMAAASVLVWYFRKNWRRWGGYDDEGD